MARTQHLPLYQSVFVYTREVYRVRMGLPKATKHDLGQEVCSSSIKMLKFVVLANSTSDKKLLLDRMSLEIEVQWVLLRFLYEFKAISPGQFKLLSERLTDIGKQTQAWMGWAKKSLAKNN